MAINNYLQTCDYKIGGLQPYIYLIHRNALKLNIKAKGVEVFFNKTKDADVYKLQAQTVIYQQQEAYSAKYRFNSTLTIAINEQYQEPFFYGLRTLRTNQYYIIIEDKKGVQYLVNPELFTKMTYEYTFTDTIDNHNSVEISYNNLSNFPLLIFKEKVESNILFLNEECNYTIGNIYRLFMTSFKDLTVKDDGVKASELYISDASKLKEVEYLKESFTLIEKYDGNRFETDLSFSIPLSENQFEWAYDLLEFKDNSYKALLRTTNDNYLLIGQENGLFPEYNITTSESDEELNKINVRFTTLSQYPILYTNDVKQYRWIKDGELCFGFDKYQMLTQQYSTDWGETWVNTDPIVKKKGEIIQTDSESCKLYQWVEDGEYCETISTEYVKWLSVDGEFLCENGNKCQKLQKYTSYNNVNFSPQEEYAIGNIIATNSSDCNYIVVKWVDTDGNVYEQVNENLTKFEFVEDECKGVNLYDINKEMVTSNGIDYYNSGENVYSIKKENCCACGYVQNEEFREVGYVCGKDIEGTFTITNTSGNWSVNDKTFTSNKINDSQTTVQRIYFRTTAKELKFDINQSSESSYDYLIIGKLDTEVINNTGSTNNFYNHKSKTTGTTSMAIPDTNEHFVELMYRKDSSQSSGRDNVIVTLSIDKSPYNEYDLYTKYQKYITCNDEYANVKQFVDEFQYELFESNSCNCGYVGTNYIFNNEYVNGSEISDNYAPFMVFEIWRETKCDGTLTGNVEYRNPTFIEDYAPTDAIIITYKGNGSNGVSLANYNNGLSMYIDGIKVNVNTLYYIFGDTNEHIVTFVGVKSVFDRLFTGLNGIISVTIGNSITGIQEYAFQNCSSLTSVTIGNRVENIYNYAFSNCKALTSVVIGNIVTSIGDGAFQGCNNLTSVINFSSLSISKGSSDYGYVGYYADKVINAPRGSIEGDFVFGKLNLLYEIYTLCGYIGNDTELTLPSNYKGGNYAIGEKVFSNYDNLERVTIPDSVTSIGNYAFSDCDNLNKVTIGDGVTSIGNYAFRSCDSLTNLTIGNGVTSIGEYAFMYCTRLTNLTIGDSVTSIGNGAFSSCDSLTSVTIPDSVTTIGEYAFRYCTRLTNLTIGDSVTSIGDVAFQGCSSLFSISSKARIAPKITSFTFNNIASGGTLYYPKDSNYSSWLSTNYFYLGYYEWEGRPSEDWEMPD